MKSGRVSQEKLVKLEAQALSDVRGYDKGAVGIEQVMDSTIEYAAVLLEGPHPDSPPVPEKTLLDLQGRYRTTLEEKPWKQCSCAICSEISIEVAIFRSSNRNKRRGMHNLHVYHNHIKSLEGSISCDSQIDLFCH